MNNCPYIPNPPGWVEPPPYDGPILYCPTIQKIEYGSETKGASGMEYLLYCTTTHLVKGVTTRVIAHIGSFEGGCEKDYLDGFSKTVFESQFRVQQDPSDRTILATLLLAIKRVRAEHYPFEWNIASFEDYANPIPSEYGYGLNRYYGVSCDTLSAATLLRLSL